MAQDSQNVPKYFADFVKQNADEHGQLATKIETSRGELREEMATSRGELREEMATSRGELRQEMATSRGELREEMSTSRGELREEMATTRGDLRNEIAKSETRLTRWTAAIVIGGPHHRRHHPRIRQLAPPRPCPTLPLVLPCPSEAHHGAGLAERSQVLR